MNEKPTTAEIEEYARRLEDMLDYLHVKVSVVLFDVPIQITTSINGVNQKTQNIWIKNVNISNTEVLNLEVQLYHNIGIGFDMKNPLAIWQDAFDIQNSLYQHLNRKVGNPKDNDIYWKLWEKLNK